LAAMSTLMAGVSPPGPKLYEEEEG
jgi:hypothetical protein